MTTIAATDAALPLPPVRWIAQPGRSLSDELLTLVAAAAHLLGAIDQMIMLLKRDGRLAEAEWWTQGGRGQWSRRQGWGLPGAASDGHDTSHSNFWRTV